jgi:hypothetical protein
VAVLFRSIDLWPYPSVAVLFRTIDLPVHKEF